MTEQQIIKETLRYIDDTSYKYAILIDGEWGSGKTFFVNNNLKRAIDDLEAKKENPRIFKYISLYGCKDVTDIQESLVWGMADEARKFFVKEIGIDKSDDTGKNLENEKGKVGKNILLSTKKIGNEVVKKFLPEKTVYDIAADWINLKAYIFVFDDLERCECSINEVFGFLNGLVEHEGTKVIIVANEKEIDTEKSSQNSELQYLIATNTLIDWPQREKRNTWLTEQRNNKIRIDELEWRRKILFPSQTVNSDYKRIREKLIGVKLTYQPDLDKIIDQIILSTQYKDKMKDLLMSHKKDFMYYMNFYRHHNLRTFQFFLSKIDYLLMEVNLLEISPENREKIIDIVVDECFRCAIEFKSNYQPINDPYSFISREENAKSKTIKEYVNRGEFEKTTFSEEIANIEEELNVNVSSEDPVNLIYHQYYCHTQQWNEEQLDAMLARLEKDKYPTEIYGKMIIIVVRLVDLGFDEKYLINTKKFMFSNIKKHNPVKRMSVDLWFIDNDRLREKVKRAIDEINVAIDSHSEMQNKKNLNEILQSENWMDELDMYTNSLAEGQYKDIAIFSKAKAENWYAVIHKATPEEIDDFRHWLSGVYPSTNIRNSFKEDAKVIIELWKMIVPDEESDLIKKACAIWLKNQIQSIIQTNMPEQYESLIACTEEEHE